MTVRLGTGMALNGKNDFIWRLEIERSAGQLDWIRVMQSGSNTPDGKVDGESCGRELLAQNVVADRLKNTEQVVAADGEGEIVVAGEEDIGYACRVGRVRVHVQQDGES